MLECLVAPCVKWVMGTSARYLGKWVRGWMAQFAVCSLQHVHLGPTWRRSIVSPILFLATSGRRAPVWVGMLRSLDMGLILGRWVVGVTFRGCGMVILRDSSGVQITYCVSRRMNLGLSVQSACGAWSPFPFPLLYAGVRYRREPCPSRVKYGGRREGESGLEYVSLGRLNAQEHCDVV